MDSKKRRQKQIDNKKRKQNKEKLKNNNQQSSTDKSSDKSPDNQSSKPAAPDDAAAKFDAEGRSEGAESESGNQKKNDNDKNENEVDDKEKDEKTSAENSEPSVSESSADSASDNDSENSAQIVEQDESDTPEKIKFGGSAEQVSKAKDNENKKEQERKATWLEKKLGLKPGQKLKLNVFGKNQVMSPVLVGGKLRYLPDRDQLDPSNKDDREILESGQFAGGRFNPNDPYNGKGYRAMGSGEVKAYSETHSKGNDKEVDNDQEPIYDVKNKRFLYPTTEKDKDGKTIFRPEFTDATESERLSNEFVTTKAAEKGFPTNDDNNKKLEAIYDLAIKTDEANEKAKKEKEDIDKWEKEQKEQIEKQAKEEREKADKDAQEEIDRAEGEAKEKLDKIKSDAEGGKAGSSFDVGESVDDTGSEGSEQSFDEEGGGSVSADGQKTVSVAEGKDAKELGSDGEKTDSNVLISDLENNVSESNDEGSLSNNLRSQRVGVNNLNSPQRSSRVSVLERIS